MLGFEIFGQDKDGSRTVNTNWPRRLSFPTFWLNVLEYLAGGTEDSQLASTRPGRPVELRAGRQRAGADGRRSGEESSTQCGERPRTCFSFTTRSELGVYDVRRRDQVIERFAVNLFDRQESDVRVRPSQDPRRQRPSQPADIRIGNVDVAATRRANALAHRSLEGRARGAPCSC